MVLWMFPGPLSDKAHQQRSVGSLNHTRGPCKELQAVFSPGKRWRRERHSLLHCAPPCLGSWCPKVRWLHPPGQIGGNRVKFKAAVQLWPSPARPTLPRGQGQRGQPTRQAPRSRTPPGRQDLRRTQIVPLFWALQGSHPFKSEILLETILIADLLLTELESLNPRKAHGVCREEEAAHGSVVNPAEWATPLFCCCASARLRPTHFDWGSHYQENLPHRAVECQMEWMLCHIYAADTDNMYVSLL